MEGKEIARIKICYNCYYKCTSIYIILFTVYLLYKGNKVIQQVHLELKQIVTLAFKYSFSFQMNRLNIN